MNSKSRSLLRAAFLFCTRQNAHRQIALLVNCSGVVPVPYIRAGTGANDGFLAFGGVGEG